MLTNFFKRDLTVTRKGIGGYFNGIWQDGLTTDFVIKASVHPTPAKVLQTLPEGYRTSNAFTLYTNTELLTANNNTNNPDEVLINGENFIVAKIENWGNTELSHYEVVVVKDRKDVN